MGNGDQIGLIVGGAFTAATALLLIAQHIIGPRPSLKGKWAQPARVRVASSASVDLLLLVREAVALWRDQGAEILPLVDHMGADDPVAGEIVVCLRGADFDIDHTGETITTFNDDWTIRKAQCRIRLLRLEVVAHELGHALGFNHVAKNGHVLNARYSRLGMSFTGCSAVLRDS